MPVGIRHDQARGDKFLPNERRQPPSFHPDVPHVPGKVPPDVGGYTQSDPPLPGPFPKPRFDKSSTLPELAAVLIAVVVAVIAVPLAVVASAAEAVPVVYAP